MSRERVCLKCGKPLKREFSPKAKRNVLVCRRVTCKAYGKVVK